MTFKDFKGQVKISDVQKAFDNLVNRINNSIDTYKGKGVLIPESNLDEVILNPNVEEAINNGDFVIYTMENISDAIMVLLGDNETSFEDIAASIDREIKKYKN